MILMNMSEPGSIGFGHLRFQEYLAAEEMCFNRSVEIRALLGSRWWRDACVFFAKMEGRFDWLIKTLSVRDLSKHLGGTLGAMIGARPMREQEVLIQAIELRLRSDEGKQAPSLKTLREVVARASDEFQP